MPPSVHIDEVRLEDYARGDRSDTLELLRHLQSCPVCQERLEEIREFMAFVCADPASTSGHIYRRHDTANGTIFLSVTGSDAWEWNVRIIGSGAVESRTFRRGATAKAWAEGRFQENNPGHECGDGCSNWR